MLGWLLLSAVTAVPDPSPWTQYGVGGLAFSALTVVSVYVYKRESARGDRLEAEVHRLNEAIVDKHLPALESSTHATQQVTQLLLDQARRSL